MKLALAAAILLAAFLAGGLMADPTDHPGYGVGDSFQEESPF